MADIPDIPLREQIRSFGQDMARELMHTYDDSRTLNTFMITHVITPMVERADNGELPPSGTFAMSLWRELEPAMQRPGFNLDTHPFNLAVYNVQNLLESAPDEAIIGAIHAWQEQDGGFTRLCRNTLASLDYQFLIRASTNRDLAEATTARRDRCLAAWRALEPVSYQEYQIRRAITDELPESARVLLILAQGNDWMPIASLDAEPQTISSELGAALDYLNSLDASIRQRSASADPYRVNITSRTISDMQKFIIRSWKGWSPDSPADSYNMYRIKNNLALAPEVVDFLEARQTPVISQNQ